MTLTTALAIALPTMLMGCTMSDTDPKKPAVSAPATKAVEPVTKPPAQDLLPTGYVPSNPDSQPSVEQHLEVTITSAGAFPKGEPVTVTFRLTNKGTAPIRACKVFTPLEDHKRMSLEVTDTQGASRRLSGSKKAGPMPGQADWVTLEAGQVLEAKVDLREEFDLPPGRYKVHFVGHPYVNHLKDSAPHPFVVEP